MAVGALELATVRAGELEALLGALVELLLDAPPDTTDVGLSREFLEGILRRAAQQTSDLVGLIDEAVSGERRRRAVTTVFIEH